MQKLVLSLIATGVALCLTGGNDDATEVVETNVIETNVIETDVVATEVPMPAGVKALSWYADGEAAVAEAVERKVNNTQGAAKNVILFVGDGMGISTVTAARILEGQMHGKMGEEHQLSFDKFPFSGLAKTYNTNQQTPDSAGTMTALMTGVKTKAGVIGVTEASLRGEFADFLAHGVPGDRPENSRA